jgi:hypothetical protein
MTTSPLARSALLLLLLTGCRTSAPASEPPASSEAAASSKSASDPFVQGLSSLVKAQPDNGAILYALASRHAELGEEAPARQWLERLVALDWSFAPADTDFGAFARTPAYRALADRLAAREPQVARSRPAFTLAEKDLIAEGVAHDPVTDTFFVSSIYKRKVVAISRDGKVRNFTSEGQNGLWSPLGMKVDAQRRHLWVACFAGETFKRYAPEQVGRAGLFQFDLDSGDLIRKLTLDNQPRPHLLNDIALSAAGDVFITDSDAGAVHVLRAGTNILVPLVPEDSLIYPNGIALSEDGARLYVADFQGLSSVDPRTGQLTPVKAPPGTALQGIDGLSLYKGSLIAIQNGLGRARVSRFHFGEDPTRVERAEVLESGNRLFNIPTTGAVAGDAFVYIANSQLRGINPQGELAPLDQLQETVLLQVELSGRQGQ